MKNNNQTAGYGVATQHEVAAGLTTEYAGLSIRFVAVLIDSMILFAINGILQFALLGSAVAHLPLNPPGVKLALSWLISIAMACGYEAFFIGRIAATPGKIVLGLKVVRPDGSPVSYRQASCRYFARILSTVILGSGHIMAGFDSRKRALHDLICDTRVIGSETRHVRAPAAHIADRRSKGTHKSYPVPGPSSGIRQMNERTFPAGA